MHLHTTGNQIARPTQNRDISQQTIDNKSPYTSFAVMSKLSKIKKLTKVALLAEAEELEEAGTERHREWAKSWLLKREDPTIWSQLYIEVEESDESKFRNVFRMMPELWKSPGSD